MRLASAACLRAAARSPEPMAIKPARDRLVGALAAAAVQMRRAAMNGERRMARTSVQMQKDHHHRRQRRGGKHHHRGLDPPALPGDHHVARTIGEPGDAERQNADNDQEGNDAGHCDAGLPSAASASAAMRRLAASAVSRACACLIQSAAGVRVASGNLARSASAASMSPRAASALMRLISDEAS